MNREPNEKLRTSAKIFLVLGVVLVLGSLVFLFTGFSVIGLGEQKARDPFGGAYTQVKPAASPAAEQSSTPNAVIEDHANDVSKTTGTPTPTLSNVASKNVAARNDSIKNDSPVPTSTPSASSTPIKKSGESIVNAKKTEARPTPTPIPEKAKAYLLSPRAREVVKPTAKTKEGFLISFRFEVEPKNTACTFELTHAGKIVVTQELAGSPTAAYLIKVAIPEAGLYEWQILMPHAESEKREVVIHP